MFMYGNNWGNVALPMNNWFTFQQQCIKETLDLCSSLSPVKDLQQQAIEVTEFRQHIDPKKVMEKLSSPVHFTQCVKDLADIQLAAVERFNSSNQQLTTVILDGTAKVRKTLLSELPTEQTLANLLNDNLHTTKALKDQQADYLGNVTGYQSALKAWSVSVVS
ncbi:hypothetical protein [Photobacterium minamisatsumaniensis]|uniref:hypothetical protein n=1 Tax=Photobacterium minamisatsumaniensis TaxID=2910233 RepID=UPI003D12FF87